MFTAAVLTTVWNRVLALVVAGAVLAGCGGDEATTSPTTGDPSVAAPTGTAYAAVPEPGRTLAATPAGPAEVRGFRLAVVVPDRSAVSRRLLAATQAFADDGGAVLQVFTARGGGDPVGTALAEAVASGADLVVGLGEGVVDVFTFETAQLLDQQFLVVGAQLAEPTENVTAVIWPGATGRGAAAAPDGELDPDAATEQRGSQALAVGVDAVRRGETGVVLRLPSQN
jgi:hypothetical protein